MHSNESGRFRRIAGTVVLLSTLGLGVGAVSGVVARAVAWGEDTDTVEGAARDPVPQTDVVENRAAPGSREQGTAGAGAATSETEQAELHAARSEPETAAVEAASRACVAALEAARSAVGSLRSVKAQVNEAAPGSAPLRNPSLESFERAAATCRKAGD